MSEKIYLWIEDRKDKSGYVFWECFTRNLFPNITVESKNNNSELIKAVKNLNDTNHKYIIVYDNSFDNIQLVYEIKKLKECVQQKDNVFLLDIICFEYILLEFKELIEWIYAENDEFKQKRHNIIKARNDLVNAINSKNFDYKQIESVIKYDKNISNHNIEQLSAKILYELTRNTGFEVKKGMIGDCWIKTCCLWEQREESDLCGLDKKRLSVLEKMKRIYEETSLKEQLNKVGIGGLK